jgi:hypothetical protein
VQAFPFRVKPLGAGRVPLKVPWKPTLVVPPLGSDPFQATLPTVSWVPD